MTSWFTRTAADHERGTAPSRCFPAWALAHVDPREPVMNLSVIPTRFSTRSPKLGFTVNNWGCRLTPPNVREGKRKYQKQSRREWLLALDRMHADMILHTFCLHCPEHDWVVEEHQRNCRKELGRKPHQIWWLREPPALKFTSMRLTGNIVLAVLTSSQSENLFHPVSKPSGNNVRRRYTYPKLVSISKRRYQRSKFSTRSHVISLEGCGWPHYVVRRNPGLSASLPNS